MMGDSDFRELQKVHDTLVMADKYFTHKDAMNAAVHKAEAVRATPLASSVSAALEALTLLLKDHGA